MEASCRCGRVVPEHALMKAVESGMPLKCKTCGHVFTVAKLTEVAAKPLARRGGPETSKAAAEALIPHIRAAQLRTAALVRQNPGATARELTELVNDRDPRSINRRLPELERDGIVRRGVPRLCKLTNRSASTWYPHEPIDPTFTTSAAVLDALSGEPLPDDTSSMAAAEGETE